MTEATFITNHENKYIGFIIEGHANSAAKGYDIVCAGISTISQGSIIGIRDIAGAECVSSMDETSTKISIIVTDRRSDIIDLTEVIIGMARAVIEIIHMQYPGYVNIKVEEADVL